MKLYKQILFLFFIIQSCYFAQQTETDTLKTYIKPIDPIQQIQLKFDEFEFIREKYYADIHAYLDDDKATLKLRTESLIKHSASNLIQQESTNFYFLSPLYNQYVEDSKFNPVRYVLGLAQLSAAGYIAYRHIKKYGFID